MAKRPKKTQANMEPAGNAAGLSPLVDKEGLQALLGISRETVARMLDSGLLPQPKRVSRSLRWDREEILNLWRQGKLEGPGPDARSAS